MLGFTCQVIKIFTICSLFRARLCCGGGGGGSAANVAWSQLDSGHGTRSTTKKYTGDSVNYRIGQ